MSDKEAKKKIQSYLKQAKKELVNEDYDECLSICKSIFKLDKSNFFAYIFAGKSYQSKKIDSEAMKCYIKASEIDPESVLSWKAQLSIQHKDSDFVAFFTTLTKFAKLLQIKNEPFTEVVIYIDEYIKEHGLNFTPMKKYYYRQIIPGLSELGDIIGYNIAKPSDSLKKLISIIEEEENSEVKKTKDKVKMKFSINMTEKAKLDKYNEAVWPIISGSEISKLYELMINLEHNDNDRYSAQDKLLRYKYSLLTAAPAPKKPALRDEISDFVDGLVLTKCPSELAWKIYFDWLDPTTLNDLELDNLSNYISLFGKERGFGSIFYQFLISDISPFEKSRVLDYLYPLKKGTKEKKDKENEKETKEEDERYEIFNVSPQEILTAMSNAIEKNTFSIICNRIMLEYCIHLKQYALGLDISTQFTRATVDLKYKTSKNIPNSKLSQTLNLAIIYTYYESPKNFPKAMALYDSIESKYPDDDRIRIGKALILVETNKFEEASHIFMDLINKDPNNTNAIQEYGWCQIQLKNFDIGREYLQKAIQTIQDVNQENSSSSATLMNTISKLMYRQAVSYHVEIEELDNNTSNDNDEKIKELVNKCIEYNLKCLKISANYASAFTLLGIMYYNYSNKKDRAIKCFYKAFQLDPAEIEASYRLAEHFTSIDDWEMADIVSKAVIENESAKRQLNSSFNKVQDKSWPYRILGCASMEAKNDTKAIEYFQSALRMNSFDITSWIGLGESYISSGRLEASVKVFEHVIRLANNVSDKEAEITSDMENNADWHAVYLLATSLTNMLEFERSVSILQNLLISQSENISILTLLIETLILRCNAEINKGAILRASDTLLEVFKYLLESFELENKSIKLWKCLGDALTVAIKIRMSNDRLPYEKISSIFNKDIFESGELWGEFNAEDYEIPELIARGKYVELLHLFVTLSCIGGYLAGKEKGIRMLNSSLIFNLSVSFFSWFKDSKDAKYKELSIKLANKAISLEPDNSEYWNYLGILTMDKNSKISQHCFIKAISIESKSPTYWFNLGMLYIQYFDNELANECFLRCQSLAAGTSIAWIGQALINKEEGKTLESNNLFTHSYVLSKGSEPANTLLYAVSVLDSIIGEGHDERDLECVQQLTTVNYGLMNYMKLYPNDEFALELSLLVIERLYSFNKGIGYSERLCSLLEDEYENNDSEKNLIRYCKAKCQHSRILLSSKQYKVAYDVCEEIGVLIEGVEDLTLEVQQCLLSCYSVLGLSLYFQGEFDKSLVEFKKLLDAFPENENIVVLVSQVLYAFDDTETRQAALDELLAHISEHGTSLVVCMTIAAMSLSEEWSEYMEAVQEVLQQLPLETLIADTHKEVPAILSVLDKVGKKLWQRQAILFPGDVNVWRNLDKTVSLELAVNSKTESAVSVSEAYAASGRLRETQRALILNGGGCLL